MVLATARHNRAAAGQNKSHLNPRDPPKPEAPEQSTPQTTRRESEVDIGEIQIQGCESQRRSEGRVSETEMKMKKR